MSAIYDSDVLGPLYAWTQPLPTIAGVDYTLPVVATVAQWRPDGVAGATWSTADGSIVLTNRTATTCTLRHVYSAVATEVPFVVRDGNTLVCVYRYDVSVTVNGVFVLRQTVCRNHRNTSICNC